MNEELLRKIDEARAAGYTDEQINAFLQSQQTGQLPTDAAPSGGVDRTQELLALGQYSGAKAAEYLGYGAGAAYAGKKILDAYRGTRPPVSGPVAPQQPLPTTGTPQHTFETLRAPSGQAPSVPPEQPGIMRQIQQMALDKLRGPAVASATRGMGALGAMLYSPGLNVGEDEQLRRMRAEQEEMLRRGQMR